MTQPAAGEFTATNRVPRIILLYWVIKIAATTLGETGADMVSMTYDLGYASTIGIFMAVFLGFAAVKIAIKRYEPITYWLAFTASAIVGTAISDYIDRTLGLGYEQGAALLVVLLLVVLWAWYSHKGSINVEYITSGYKECYYWLAFLISNTLGTAIGDYVADDLELGFQVSALLFTASLGVLGILHYAAKISGTLLFWLAFVLTRPFGATFGDWLTKPFAEGGLALGTVGASLLFSVVLVLAVWREAWLERRGGRIPEID